MSLLVDPRDAFQQGYMRAAYKTMDLMLKALHQQWSSGKIERALRQSVSQDILETETEAFIEHNLIPKGENDVLAR